MNIPIEKISDSNVDIDDFLLFLENSPTKIDINPSKEYFMCNTKNYPLAVYFGTQFTSEDIKNLEYIEIDTMSCKDKKFVLFNIIYKNPETIKRVLLMLGNLGLCYNNSCAYIYEGNVTYKAPRGWTRMSKYWGKLTVYISLHLCTTISDCKGLI